MSFHLFLPQMRMPVDAMVERARAAEAAGFEGIALMDHLAPPLATQHDMWEAMTMAGWLLARTDTLVVSHLVLCDAMRHPAVLARQATTLDHASGGRFELGIGWGSVPEELVTFGVGTDEPRQRVGRLGESLEVMRALWTGEPVTYEGTYFQLHEAQQRPVPTRPIPITIGGVGPRTMALVREHAHWWNVPIHRLREVEQRRPLAGEARVSAQVMVGLIESEADREAAVELLTRRFGRRPMGGTAAVGTVGELTEHVRGLAAQGIERFYVWFADFAPPATLRRFGEVIEAARSLGVAD